MTKNVPPHSDTICYELSVDSKRLDALYQRVSKHLSSAKKNIVKTIDTHMVTAYWCSGREIVMEQQQGEKRANYGSFVIRSLSQKLQQTFGKGFSETTLNDIRKFYLIYQLDAEHRKPHTLCAEFEKPNFFPTLGWSHYRILMRIERKEARRFYEIEANKNNWSSRILKRQVNSFLYERIAKSKDKEGLINLTKEGNSIKKPSDAIKDPLVLEFLDIPSSHKLTENDLETALINHMQYFLLELGQGFAFVGRQKKIVLNGRHYFPDLVMYHTVLKCYIIIDIKLNELTHGDLGQMQFYVNYYDKECRTEGDNATLGLILCAEKDDAMVKYTLDEKTRQIFASKYQFHLPSEKDLAQELKRERHHIECQLKEKSNNHSPQCHATFDPCS